MDLVQLVGDPRRVVGLLGPVAAEVLERLPTQQHRIRALGLPPGRLAQLRILVRGIEPVAEHLDGAVEGDVLGDRECPHIKY